MSRQWLIRFTVDGVTVEHETTREVYDMIVRDPAGFQRLLSENFTEAVMKWVDDKTVGIVDALRAGQK